MTVAGSYCARLRTVDVFSQGVNCANLLEWEEIRIDDSAMECQQWECLPVTTQYKQNKTNCKKQERDPS